MSSSSETGGAWSVMEDVSLCESWLHISHCPIRHYLVGGKFLTNSWRNGGMPWQRRWTTIEAGKTLLVSFVKNGWWDMGKLRTEFSEEMIQKIIGTPVGKIGVTPYGSSWKLTVPPKLKFFCWLMYHGKILSNEQRAKRQLTVDASCKSCGCGIESVIHLLRDCPRAKEVYRRVQSLSLPVGIYGNGGINTCLVMKKIYLIALSVRSMSRAIGAGGVLRNSEGLWIGGFTVNLGLGQVQDAEIWGLFFGLKLAISHNSSPLIVEMDSALAVSLNANK
ncbi:unnamed protein product [Prunus armeniaca]